MIEKRLIEILNEKGVQKEVIDNVIESGYSINYFGGLFGTNIQELIIDKMYGNKMYSSCFEIDKFIKYINGDYNFPRLSNFLEYTVKTFEEIDQILSDPIRKRSIEEGTLSFRGQPSQHILKRKVPNPVRANEDGEEISIISGLYRQKKDELYNFNKRIIETNSFQYILNELEPNNQNIHTDAIFSRDVLHIEQHYATQTAGLDVTFDVETAIFFATYKFNFNSENKAYYKEIEQGFHEGVIYGFRFREPPVKKEKFLIEKFDLFKTYHPERIIRQNCGLPLFGDYERNIAICDIDFIIYLDKDFDYKGKRSPEYMFPNIKEDLFYKKLLELKVKYPKALSNIVEYIYN